MESNSTAPRVRFGFRVMSCRDLTHQFIYGQLALLLFCVLFIKVTTEPQGRRPAAASGTICRIVTMASSSTGVARGSLYRPYARSSSGNSSSLENLPPRTLARVAKEVRDLMKNPPEGIRLVVDGETGLPSSLGEIVVSGLYSAGANQSGHPVMVQRQGTKAVSIEGAAPQIISADFAMTCRTLNGWRSAKTI